MEVLKAANLGLRFLLELCVLAALGYWGYHTGSRTLAKIVLAVGAPLLAAIVWGMFVAPKASVSVSGPVRFLVELAVFGVAVAALIAAGRPTLAGILALAYVINRALIQLWGQ